MFNKTLKHSQFTNTTTDYCPNLNTQINRTTKQTHFAKDRNNPKRRGKLPVVCGAGMASRKFC